MSNVAERISIRLERVGLSASAASLAAGLSRSAVTDILAGNSNSPRLDTLEKLCGPLQCSIHELVSDEAFRLQEEINRYKAEVEDLDGRADREYQKRMEADAVERRDLFAAAALIGALANPLTHTGDDQAEAFDRILSRRVFQIADAMEVERALGVSP